MNPLTQSPLEKLILARAVLEQPEQWTQGTYARDKDGFPLLEDHPRAVCWCMTGACRLANADPTYLTRLLEGTSVPIFNDSCIMTHNWVLEIFDQAIAKLL